MKDFKVLVVLLAVVALVGAVNAALVDDFESYAEGNVRDVASPPWTAINGTGYADVWRWDNDNYLTYGWADVSAPTRGVYRGIGPIADTSTASTLYQRIRITNTAVNHAFGLSDVTGMTWENYGDFEVQMIASNNAGTVELKARNGGDFVTYANLNLYQWYSIWAVIDQTTDTYDIYLNTGTADATLADRIATGVAFRNGTTDSLVSYLGLAGNAAEGNFRLDDIALSDGVDLSLPVPEPATMSLLGIGGITALLRRKK